jgi:hypothetical protein
MRNDILEKKEEIIKMINNNEPKALICRMLKCKPLTLDEYLKKMNIQYKGNAGRKGKKGGEGRKSALDYMKKNILSTSKLRKKLIEDKIKENKCEICNIYEWMGQKLTLELHHKDGNRFNNKLDNLQILCPNCHSLIPNHKYVKKIKNRTKPIVHKIKHIISEKHKICKCGNPIEKRSTLCVKCYNLKQQKVKRPEYNVLINDINILGYTGTGKKYGVSDNAIRKWIKNMSL